MSNKVNITAGEYEATGYESITVADTAVSLSAGTYTQSDGSIAKKATITVETGQIRWRYDGTAPTSSEGHLSNPTNVIVIKGSINIQNFRAIRATSTSGTIRVTYED